MLDHDILLVYLARRPTQFSPGHLQKALWPAGRGLTWTASRRPVQAEVRAGPAGLLRPLSSPVGAMKEGVGR